MWVVHIIGEGSEVGGGSAVSGEEYEVDKSKCEGHLENLNKRQQDSTLSKVMTLTLHPERKNMSNVN